MSGPFNRDDMGQAARDYVAENCKEGVDPRSDIEDWGDYNEDYNTTSDEYGTTYSSAEDVQEYYDCDSQVQDIQIL